MTLAKAQSFGDLASAMQLVDQVGHDIEIMAAAKAGVAAASLARPRRQAVQTLRMASEGSKSDGGRFVSLHPHSTAANRGAARLSVADDGGQGQLTQRNALPQQAQRSIEKGCKRPEALSGSADYSSGSSPDLQ